MAVPMARRRRNELNKIEDRDAETMTDAGRSEAAGLAANGAANTAAGRPRDTEVKETPLEALASICAVLVVGLFIMGFIFQNFVIPSASMEKTLLIGDHVVVDRISMAPPTSWAPFIHYRPVHRGDVIVFLKPHPVPPDPPDIILVKRAIGIPGDHIHLRHGVVYVNGVAQNEPYAKMPNDNDGNPDDAYNPYRDDFPAIAPGPYAQLTELWREELPTHIQGDDLVVPPGHVFAMGDNRTESLDSRYWGFVPDGNIMGRPMFVYWSFKTPASQEDKTSMGDRISFMFHIVTHFFRGTRWSRTFHIVR
jgi:signal peptidase I